MIYYVYNQQNQYIGNTETEPENNFTLIEPTYFVVTTWNGTEWVEGATQEQLLQAQADTIKFNKEECYRELFPTDWYFIRKAETGVDVPQSILNDRAAIRAKYNQ